MLCVRDVVVNRWVHTPFPIKACVWCGGKRVGVMANGWGKGLEEAARRVIVCGVQSVVERGRERERNTYMYIHTHKGQAAV